MKNVQEVYSLFLQCARAPTIKNCTFPFSCAVIIKVGSSSRTSRHDLIIYTHGLIAKHICSFFKAHTDFEHE